MMGMIGINFAKKTQMTILHHVSGIVKPGRYVESTKTFTPRGSLAIWENMRIELKI